MPKIADRKTNLPQLENHRYTALAMNWLEKILGSKITVEGLENIPKKPVLFVANHFTRSETFVIPYIIHKYTKRPVRCLGDSGLFHGILGRFLKSVGALSTKDEKRDLTIISDLMAARYDWMIYPEGSMIKNKKIISEGRFSPHSFIGVGQRPKDNRMKTGAAVLALKSELYRNDLIEAYQQQKTDLLECYKQDLNVEFSEDLKNLQTHIVPLNITYYPIRPGKNIIQKIAGRIIKKLPKQFAEELEIEGNLLLSSTINISFGKAIALGNYAKNVKNLIYQIPIIKSETKVNLILKYFKYRLTRQFMEKVYLDTQINIDHLFTAVLFYYPKNEIKINHLKSLIYLSATHIGTVKKYRLNSSIIEENIFKILNRNNIEELDDIIKLAIKTDIIKESKAKDGYIINKDKLSKDYNFHQIRVENTLQVILNEFLLLKNAANIVKKDSTRSEEEIRQKSFKYLFNRDLEMFKADYEKYYDANLSKAKNIGAPFFIDNSNNKKTSKNLKKGILLIHGYLSTPKEMDEAAKYFNKLGFKIYSVRLKGHGTAPHNLEDVKWQDWYDSLNRGYQALRLLCDKIFLIGFSTGGLLSLVAAFKKDNNIDGIICINPALKLNDIRAKFSFGIYMWNDLLEKLNLQKGQLKYVENGSENPEINYSRNYIKGVKQLELLMKYCQENLKKITIPLLLIQSDKDPAVNPKSAKIVINKVSSKIKELQEVDNDRHIIIKGQGSNDLFKKMEVFLNKLLKSER